MNADNGRRQTKETGNLDLLKDAYYRKKKGI